MAIENKRPSMKQTVGAQYVCFATESETGDFTATYETSVEKTETVKNISITENGDTTNVYASGLIYDSVGKTSSVELGVEVIAFNDLTVHKMRGDSVDKAGLILKGGNRAKPFFAYGKVVKLKDDKFRFEWYPKCKLTTKTDDVATSEDSFSEQTDTLTITAYPFNDAGDISSAVASDVNFPEGLTEEKFFAKPILTVEDLASTLSV